MFRLQLTLLKIELLTVVFKNVVSATRELRIATSRKSTSTNVQFRDSTSENEVSRNVHRTKLQLVIVTFAEMGRAMKHLSDRISQ